MFVFDGIDGCGKDALIVAVKEKLERDHYEVIVTRQPTVKGKRELISAMNDPVLSLLTLAADYQKQVLNEIIPAAKRNEIILCSRWFPFSAYAYQVAQGVNVSTIDKVLSIVEPFTPDVIIYIDVEPSEAMRRKQKKDLLDKRKLTFLEDVRRNYINLTMENKRYVEMVDNMGTFDDCLDSVMNILEDILD